MGKNSKPFDLGAEIARRSEVTASDRYLLYLERFLAISLGQFEWKGLPEEIDARYMETTIFTNGSALFFKEDVAGYICLGATAFGRWNVYGIPEQRTAYGANGVQFPRDSSNSVIIWNNLTHSKDWLLLTDYAKKLAELDEITMTNARAQKTPILIKSTEAQAMTLQALYKKYEGNEPFIFADNGLDVSGFTVLNTGAPWIAAEVYKLKTEIWNEALTYLGVVNVQTSKKERLIKDEVEKQNGGTMASRETRLKAREIAAGEINKMFGLNVSVSFKDANDNDEGGEPLEPSGNVSRETNENAEG